MPILCDSLCIRTEMVVHRGDSAVNIKELDFFMFVRMAIMSSSVN